MRFVDLFGGLFEAQHLPAFTTPLSERVAPGPGYAAETRRFDAGIGQGNELKRTKSKVSNRHPLLEHLLVEP